MKFSFQHCPGWFNTYLLEEYMDEFQNIINSATTVMDIPVLLESACNYFLKKGFTVWIEDRGLWFEVAESVETTYLILKYSD